MLKNVFGFLGKSKKPDVVLDESKSNQEPAEAPATIDGVQPASESTEAVAESPAIAESQDAPVAATEPEVAPEVAPETTSEPVAESAPASEPVAQTPFEPDDRKKALADRYRSAIAEQPAVDFTEDTSSIENADLTIAAAYKQVFGNAYLMESERLPEAESQLRGGEISVSDFVRQLAKSDRYRALFWDKYTNVTAIELNFKHLLGRAPESYAEISQHIQILAAGGFEAEIDSYIDSDEYLENFGDYRVPYLRGYATQVGKNLLSYTRAFPMTGAACSSDKSAYVKPGTAVRGSLLADRPSDIPALRPIPDEPKNVPAPPKPRVPKEIKGIARELSADIRRRQVLRAY